MASSNEIFSAINISAPWRGQNVAPGPAVTTGEMAAVMYLWGPFIFVPPTGGDNDGKVQVGVIPTPGVNYAATNVGSGIGVR